MVSGDAVEDLNVLSLRSRTIDVDSRHPELSPHFQHGESEALRKQLEIAAESTNSMDDAKSNSPREDCLPTVLRPEGSAGAESRPSPTDIELPSSASLAENGAIGAVDASKQLDSAQPLPIRESTSGVAEGRRAVHKRFRSESPESEIGEDSKGTILAGERESANAQLELDDNPDAASDDDGVPETLSTNYKQSLPHAPTPKPPKSKKPKLKTAAPEAIKHEKPVSSLIPHNGNLKAGSDKRLPFTEPKVTSIAQRKSRSNRPASKRAKDITKDGITYRTISSEGLRGETSPWLPAKASPESRTIKERLLVRKRVQEVNIGRRPRFVVSR
ncbi:hypothetical protein EPUS_08656 [Endocarpon pusillum Z07020]|uniref:Uncharacterized protein n=1 Tax=Endocarpon pusillum (strain Z07020 / HMAS-L-300199) TaxID=1263415 RepID=U1HHA2_ENDPU|nr:uncharacterized protein EPUS_08656 [Endocarpon pusillum Z07020]ERF68219.1 hypothetical protein EPUS_08656 [Endocarpon pusillum Z07020]